jgi:hypothetical protein
MFCADCNKKKQDLTQSVEITNLFNIMPIWDLTSEDQEAKDLVTEILGFPDIRCYKGDRKTGSGDNTRPGADLKQFIRISTTSGSAIAILNDVYNSRRPNGDYIVEEIRLYIAMDEVDLTFEAQMKAFDATGVQLVCDRRRISKRAKEINTYKGKRRVLVDCDEPCPLADSPNDWDCPNKCKPDGILHFYIREVLDSGLMTHAQFEIKSYQDVKQLTNQLRRIKKQLGSLTQSPYPCFWTRHKIPFILSRISRTRKRPATELKPQIQGSSSNKKEYVTTGKKSDAEFWDLDIQVDPAWMEWYERQKMVQELRVRGLSPRKEVVAGLMAGKSIDIEAIAASIIEVPALSPVPEPAPEPEARSSGVEEIQVTTIFTPTSKEDQFLSPQQVDLIDELFAQQGWGIESISLMLYREAGVLNLESVTNKDYVKIHEIASSLEKAQYWVKQVEQVRLFQTRISQKQNELKIANSALLDIISKAINRPFFRWSDIRSEEEYFKIIELMEF